MSLTVRRALAIGRAQSRLFAYARHIV